LLGNNDNHRNPVSESYHSQIILLIFGLLLIRLVSLFLSPYNLHGDEAQYWAWSKDLDWGYFTKPPGIAAVIGATTSIFGDAEWAVRLGSPLLHSATGYVIYRTGRYLFSGATGFWAAALYILMPAVWMSSAIISTDVPLLFCYAVALNGWAHLRSTPSLLRAGQTGLAIGLGVLCKYAMLFFLPALILIALIDRPTRKAFLSIYGGIILLLLIACVTPNLCGMRKMTLPHSAIRRRIPIFSKACPSTPWS